MNRLDTTSWDQTSVYKHFSDPAIAADIQTVEAITSQLSERMGTFKELVPKIEKLKLEDILETVPLARELYRKYLDADVLCSTMGSYAYMAITVDSQDQNAQTLHSKTMQLGANLVKEIQPLNVFFLRAPDAYLEELFKDGTVSEMRFLLNHSREHRDFLLDVPQEVMLAGLAVDGLHSWNKLWNDLAGSIKAKINGEEVGLAQATNILRQSERENRKAAYQGINEAWAAHEISAAAILNSINGWRNELYKTRSHIRNLHYLDVSVHQQRIQRDTLETLIQTTFAHRHIGQKALKLISRELGTDKLAPWDLEAPYPRQKTSGEISFPAAIDLIANAFGEFNPEMADFARMMHKKNWIDSTPTPNRGSGAYCSGLEKVREPRVFITYEGSVNNVITLAHEIGHAYHSWIMRDLPLGETNYSMPLAETASIFAETLVRQALSDQAKDKETQKMILWQELDKAHSLLINIPARFEFEREMVEARMQKTLSPKELKDLNVKAWKKWYGDSLESYNEMFWASKMHFSFSGMGFYNYTYLFGYLFSLSIYGRKDSYGASFKDLYVKLLRDTGTMTAEDLVQKYLKEDITRSEFWENALKTVGRMVDHYEDIH